MKIVVNPKKIKTRIEEEKNRANSKKEFDPKDSVILRATKAGKLRARVLPYVHNEDPSSEPFATRAYHYGIPGSTKTFYCPQENEGKKCEICDFVWGEMKASKGNKDQVKYWSQFLPKHNLFVPVWVYDRANEGVKLFRLTVRKNEESKWKTKIYSFWDDEESWMDPEDGYDVNISYVDASDDQKKLFNAKIFFENIELARKSTVFEEYEKALGMVPNLEDVYERKTTEDTVEACRKWANALGKEIDSDKDMTDGDVVEGGKEEKVEKAEKAVAAPKKEKTATSKKVTATDLEDLEAQLQDLGLED